MRARPILLLSSLLLTIVWAPATLAQCSLNIPSVLTGPYQVGIMVCPAGDGDSLAHAWLMDQPLGSPLHTPPDPVDATISAVIRDGFGNPIPDFPAEDVWLTFDGVCSCTPGMSIMADANSNANGVVTFSGPLLGGGCANSPTVELYINGTLCATASGLNLLITSVDAACGPYVCDGVVNPFPNRNLDSLAMNCLLSTPCANLNFDLALGDMLDAGVLADHTFNGPPAIPHQCP